MGTRELTPRAVIDVSQLPNVVFAHHSLLWWGTMGLALIEGTFLAILIGAYFFLRSRVVDWPPGILPPYLLWGTLNTVLILVSLIPNAAVKKAARGGELRNVQVGLLIMCAIGLFALVIRAFEFSALGVRWDANAYGTAVWVLLGFHTAHLLTDWIDTIVLTVLMFTDKVEGKRYMDCYENADYWYFVILIWIPVFVVTYIAPRLL
jgi:heme/copper-type cytochrome/quinol oxidase subunit 3